MTKNSIQKIQIATNRLIILLSLWLGLFAFPPGAIAQCKPFGNTTPGLGFTQELVASLPNSVWSSGYAFDSHGNVYTISLDNQHLYKINLSSTVPGPGGVGQVHPSTDLGILTYRSGPRTGQTTYGGNFTQYSDGTVYLNTWTGLGVVQVDLETASITSDPIPGAPGGSWGIGVDPQLNSHGHHNIWYQSNGIAVIDPVDHRFIGYINIFTDGFAIDPTGNFLFTTGGLTVSKRGVSNPATPDLPVFNTIRSYGGNPDGMAFGTVGNDQVVVSNDGFAGTVTMWKFPNNDFTQTPTPIVIASSPVSGEYGDQANVGPDGYFYITYWYGTRFPDCSTNGNASVVRFGPAGRFLPPTHSDNISLTPATDTKPVGANDVLTATLITTDLSTNQTVPVANTSVTFTVVGGPDIGQTFTGTTDANGNVTFTLVNQNGAGDDVVHAQFVDGNSNTQTSNNAVITFVKPTCTAPAFTICPGNQTANTSANSCDNTVTYSSSESVTGSPAPTVTYAFTGATTGSGTGNGSGSIFNKGTTTVTLTATNSCGSATCTFTVTVEDNVKPVTVCKNISVYLGINGTVTILPSDVDGGTTDNCSFTLGLSKTTFTTTDVGPNIVTLTATDPSNNSSSCQATVTVLKRPTIVTYTGDGWEQYSDQQLLTAVLKDQLTGTTLSSKTIGFTIGSQSASNSTDATGVATANLILTQDPAPAYTVSSNFAGDGIFLPSSDSDPFDITQEDARIYYSGALMASTSGTSTSSAIVTLSATIKDISAVSGDPAYDAFKGDIRNATVTFINRDNNTVLASNVPVGLINLSDLTVGTAIKNVTLDIGPADAKQFTIGIIVNNYYTRNSSSDNTIVTVSKPLDNFVTGGGYIVLTNNSAGQKAGTPGTNNNFGFNLKYNKSNTNLQGNINSIIRRTESDNVLHVYQIKGNSMTSLAVDASVLTAKKATFNGKASIQDITNPLAPVSVDGNATLQVTMTDRGEPGNTDDIGITVWNKNGGLWYSSNWSGTKTVNQTLNGGNLKVNGASYNVISTSTSTLTLKQNTQKSGLKVDEFTVTVFPNPAAYSFSITLQSNNLSENIRLRVVDVLGRAIEKIDGLHSGQILKLGENYRPGTYIIEAIQNKQTKTIKLVKLSD